MTFFSSTLKRKTVCQTSLTSDFFPPTTMKFARAVPLTVALATTTAYPIIGDNVNCRSGPGTSYSVIRTYPRGHNVTLACQTEGTDVFGITIWDKTTDGCYVSDYYVETKVNGYVTGKCNVTGGPNCPAVKSSQATVELIAGFEGFEPDICESNRQRQRAMLTLGDNRPGYWG